ncbi:MAG: SDR family NAD(P)-dependent oxidoreductase [Chloroflexi bacterium]|nr:SDR family NAD(P)-dependent oxidoreductase [Chloroflexota bacterium]MBU1751425.1 SDR family NAD(P)-dependent oxidoreductase [Chloroflexota bacterium]
MTRNYLVTGGAGFIGTNLVERLLAQGHQVTIYDNLSRRGARLNAAWLRERHPDLRWLQQDVRDFEPLARAAQDADVIVHLAAQVAVTTSVTDPRHDFEINALGTFNVVEAARQSPRQPIVLYASTNKVYGGMEDVVIVEEATRYAYRDLAHGVPETYPLDFHSPYGCSKGTGDQYVRDYARIYGLRTVVLRQSAIYGPRQFGEEDQGWAAWFVIAAVTGRPITIYGDGKQVRDMLHVSDLIDAYEAAIDRIDQVSGRIYNVGGGPANVTSIWTEFAPLLEEYLGRPIPVSYGDWRPGDQQVCVMDIRKAQRELDWSPRVSFAEGLRQLVAWAQENRALFE